MKTTYWYSAAHDEIWEKNGSYLIRYEQFLIQMPDGMSVPDIMGLYGFKINKKAWNFSRENGFLIQLK